MIDPESLRRLAVEHQASVAADVEAQRLIATLTAGPGLGDVARAWLMAVQTTHWYLQRFNIVR